MDRKNNIVNFNKDKPKDVYSQLAEEDIAALKLGRRIQNQEMFGKWNTGDECYIIENNMRISLAIVLRSDGGFCIVKFNDRKGVRLRESRLYRTYEEAQVYVRHIQRQSRKTHHDYE